MKKIIALFLVVVLMLSVLSFYSYAEEKIDYVQSISTLDISLLSDSPLLYSTIYYEWDASMIDYNCYAFALDTMDRFIIPGSIAIPPQAYNHLGSIFDVADLVKADLAEMSNDCINIGTTRPSSRGNWHYVIAARKDTTLDYQNFNDCHFATLNENGEWLHKPGTMTVLKFNSPPSNNIIWTNEGYQGNQYISPNITYDSQIVYITAKMNHNFSAYVWSGDHYHSGRTHYYRYESVCADCSETKSEWRTILCLGPPCNTPWSIIPRVEIN